MATKIKTPEPGMELHWQGETYKSDAKGFADVPDAFARVLVESHGCVDPAKAHPYGLVVKDYGKNRFRVQDADGEPIHQGYLSSAAAYSLLKTYSPAEDDAEAIEEDDEDGGFDELTEEQQKDGALQAKQKSGGLKAKLRKR